VTRRLRPEEKASAVAPLTDIQEAFLQVHLARGASPKAVRDTMNRLARMDETTIRLQVRPQPFRTAQGQSPRSWAQLAGTREVSMADVRRSYDRLRKSPGTFDRDRKQALAGFKSIDGRNRAIAPYTGVMYASARKLHDLGMARRFGANQSELEEIADGEAIPHYLQE
jgi:hypothetical protein